MAEHEVIEATSRAWAEHGEKLWRERLETYGLRPLPSFLPTRNHFVGSEPLRRASQALTAKGVPLRMTRIGLDDFGACLHFLRPPTALELLRSTVHDYGPPQLQPCDDHPLRLLDRCTGKRVFELRVVAAREIRDTDICGWESLKKIDFQFELQVGVGDVHDEEARGGCLYVAQEGSTRDPMTIPLPGRVCVPVVDPDELIDDNEDDEDDVADTCLRGTTKCIYTARDFTRRLRSIVLGLRVQAADGRTLCVASIPLEEAFAFAFVPLSCMQLSFLL